MRADIFSRMSLTSATSALDSRVLLTEPCSNFSSTQAVSRSNELQKLYQPL